jgi:multicomponent Na+:H+ antiporter subunit D
LSALAPLSVAVPLLVAAVLAFGGSALPRLASDLLAIAAAAATAVLTLVLLIHVSSGLDVVWFGGWHTEAGAAIGIDFAVDAVGAGLAAFIALLMVLALVSSAERPGVKAPYYQVLMLTFLAGMVGFCLSGDLFNMFVLFELMSISAVALVGYNVRERAAIEGGLNFAVVNTIGGFLFLLGIGLIYSRTGALNLAQMGHALGRLGNDRVVVAGFVLIGSGLLVKAAVVPFHFWLADAYAVALTPVCILLAGAMSELGIYGLGRIWFTAFSPAFAHHGGTVRAILIAVGLLTSLWGGLMALAVDHLKRLLAFVTISFVGVYLTSLGLLDSAGVAGTAVYVVADGFGKAFLFACAGILDYRFGQLSQQGLHGRGRSLRGLGLMFAAGGLLIASLPPFGAFLGKSMIEDAAIKAGYGFVPAFVVLASALCGGAILRAAARIFLGWGRPSEPASQLKDDAEPEPAGVEGRTPLRLLLPALALLAGALATGAPFELANLAATAGARFTDTSAYIGQVLGGRPVHVPGVASSAPEWYDWLLCGAATVMALGIAAAGLWARRVTPRLAGLGQALARALVPIRRLHSGRVGDYVAALTLGVGIFGGLMALTLR